MSKVRDQMIVVRVATPLRSELEAAAVEEGRTLSNLVRKILIDHASERLAGRITEAA